MRFFSRMLRSGLSRTESAHSSKIMYTFAMIVFALITIYMTVRVDSYSGKRTAADSIWRRVHSSPASSSR